MTQGTIVFAGGGTGGHVFPMIAVADVLRRIAPESRLVFVGSERGLEARLVPEGGYELEFAPARPIRGGGLFGAVSGVASAARALPGARALLQKYRPSAVLSIGGYVAGPVSLAARTLFIPLALLEPNAEIGLANRLIAPLVQRAYTAFARATKHFRQNIVLETGVPIRSGFSRVAYTPAEQGLRVLVFGGSQGAKVLNEVVPRALSELEQVISVQHQAGKTSEAETRELYRTLGMADRARVVPFIDDMPRAIAAADLVIGRAGAGTVSEICAVGRPSLLIPYPYAGDHQRFNALALADVGAALCVASAEATSERLASEIRALIEQPGRLPKMAANAAALGKPEAAEVIARDLLALAGLGAGVRGVC